MADPVGRNVVMAKGDSDSADMSGTVVERPQPTIPNKEVTEKCAWQVSLEREVDIIRLKKHEKGLSVLLEGEDADQGDDSFMGLALLDEIVEIEERFGLPKELMCWAWRTPVLVRTL